MGRVEAVLGRVRAGSRAALRPGRSEEMAWPRRDRVRRDPRSGPRAGLRDGFRVVGGLRRTGGDCDGVGPALCPSPEADEPPADPSSTSSASSRPRPRSAAARATPRCTVSLEGGADRRGGSARRRTGPVPDVVPVDLEITSCRARAWRSHWGRPRPAHDTVPRPDVEGARMSPGRQVRTWIPGDEPQFLAVADQVDTTGSRFADREADVLRATVDRGC